MQISCADGKLKSTLFTLQSSCAKPMTPSLRYFNFVTTEMHSTQHFVADVQCCAWSSDHHTQLGNLLCCPLLGFWNYYFVLFGACPLQILQGVALHMASRVIVVLEATRQSDELMVYALLVSQAATSSASISCCLGCFAKTVCTGQFFCSHVQCD